MKQYVALLLCMSKHVLKSFWRQHLFVPCSHIQWTCEHVVPKSLFREHNDLHNLILFPYSLNNARSNFPYVDSIPSNMSTKIVYPCVSAHCDCPWKGKLVSRQSFIPPDMWKGMIARSVLYMKDKYPWHEKMIQTKVLAFDTALEWDHEFPATPPEQEWNQIIQMVQGDLNPYIRKMA